MSYIIKAIILLGCAFLVAIQNDELGEALIKGHVSLFAVMVILILMGLYNVWSFIEYQMEDDDDGDD